jgi:(p)ppGpp synthase/HD superfamily hydrolase
MPNPKLTERFDAACAYARSIHNEQRRKGTDIPYAAHLLAVASLVLEDGGDEDQAIAALLHDAAEDHGGVETLEDIRRRFGDRVAHIVEGCSDSLEEPKPPWSDRKKHYIEHLREAGPDVRKVSLADKLHNARAILLDLRHKGEATWARFNGGKDGTLWYYRSLVHVFRDGAPSMLKDELARVVDQIERLAELD